MRQNYKYKKRQKELEKKRKKEEKKKRKREEKQSDNPSTLPSNTDDQGVPIKKREENSREEGLGRSITPPSGLEYGTERP